ncbi:MAG: membrane dipeptidase [Chloroflexi bacterium]|nr:membrane dipeptidase [Chloroflexota bacterium]
MAVADRTEAGSRYRLVAQVGRVPSMVVALDREQELRFERLMETLVMVDLHQHPQVLTDDIAELNEYFRSREYAWGYEAVRAGGWTTVCTANVLSAGAFASEGSYIEFSDLVTEIALMLADLAKQNGSAVRIGGAQDVLNAKQRGVIGFLPTVEHLAMGAVLHRIDVLYGLGARLAGLTYSRKTYVGDGQFERTDCGLSDLGMAAVERMNDLGMIVDLSHAGTRTALEAIEHSRVPVVFSHNAAKAIWPTNRTRGDEELLACANKGGVIGVTAVPNSLSDDPHQDINSVLDHYDYLVKLVGIDHVAIGTDTLVGDHVGFHKLHMGRDTAGRQFPAEYLSGLESPADGKNIIRGLIARGYSDEQIRKIAGENVLDLLRRVVG